MLSSASPPGPSCSQASALKSDEIEPPNFSIRDYVFNLRNEDIKRNWPFPHKFLQVCLKHDVKDLLPPFESRCSGRAKCCNKDNIVTSSEDVDNINQTMCLSSINQLVVENLSEKGKVAIEKVGILDGKLINGEAEILTTIISHDQVVCKSDETSENKLEEISERDVAVSSPVAEVPNVNHQRAEKKRKLMLKLSTTPQSSRAEDIGTASASVSDLMASKVCPVCKTFASSSNTTLNAHIDQCLSEESNTKLVVTNSLKVQVKPRKKKLMVDIYKTAPPCTLQDLDKRNGTNWASDLSLVAPSGNVSCEIKRPKLSPEFIDKGNEGAVYVDSNGIKIRILSKFDDAPSTVSGKGFKKKHLKAKYLTYLKVNTPKNKLSKHRSSSEGDCHLNSNQKIQKEESLSEILNAQDQVQSLGPATLGQWVCSKRSDMSRKLRNKEFSKISVNPLPVTKKLLSNQTDSAKASVSRKHILKLSRLSEDSAPSTTTKNVDSFDETVQTTNEKNKSPKSPVFDPLLSSFELSTSSCKESCHASPKAGKDSSLKKNDLFESRCFMRAEGDSGKNLLISKKLRKHRLIGSGKWGSELTSCDDGLVGSVKAKKLSDHHEVNFSDDTVLPGTSDAADHVPSRTVEISDFDQGKEFFDISEMQKHLPGRFDVGEKLDMQVGDAAGDEILISDNRIIDAKTRLDNLSSREEHLELVCGNETLGELPSQRSVDAEQMQCDDTVNDRIIDQSTLIEGEATFHVKDTSDLQLKECQTGSTCIEKSITCSKECVGVGLEISLEKSSITSIKNHMLMNRDPSSSPDSTASTISHPSRDFEVKDKEMVDNSASSLKNIRTEGQETQKISIELINGMSPVKQIERLRDSQPCCCSHRESLFREPQLVRQCGTAKMASVSKGNQMSSNLHIQQAICCSIPCPCLRTKNNISAISSSDSVLKFQNPVLRLMGKDLVVNHDVSYNHRLQHSSADCAPDRVSVPCYYHRFSDSSPFTSQGFWAANQPMYFQSHDMMFAGGSPVIGSMTRHNLQGHQKRSTNQPMNERGMNPPAASLFPNLMPHSSLYSSPLTSNHPFLSTPRPIPTSKMMRQQSITDGSATLLPNTSMFPSPSSSDHLTPFYN